MVGVAAAAWNGLGWGTRLRDSAWGEGLTRCPLEGSQSVYSLGREGRGVAGKLRELLVGIGLGPLM